MTNDIYKEIFRERIKAARNDAGYTQRQAAAFTGLHQSKIAKIESGDQEPDLITIATMARLYNVSTDWLFGISPTKFGDKLVTAASLYAFLATLPLSEKRVFFSGQMKISQFEESEIFRKLTPEQQLYIYNEYQKQQWEKDLGQQKKTTS